MTVQLPIVWATLLFIAGILLGEAFPSPWYFPFVILTLLCQTAFFRKSRYAVDVFYVIFWILLGCARVTTFAVSDAEPHPHFMQPLQEKAQRTNALLSERLSENGVSGKELAISQALMLGQKEQLQREVKKQFRESGVSHLLALSGMHLGILYSLIYALFFRHVRYSRWRWLCLLPVLLCLWGYALLTGMPLSLLRASVMLSVASIAMCWGRSFSALHTLSLSALLLLLFSPASIHDIGFQLSFTAVFFIIVVFQPLKERYMLTGPFSLLLLSLVAQIGTAPLSIYYFHTLPLGASLLSVVLIPLTTVIIYTGLAMLIVPCAPFAVALITLVQWQEAIIAAWANIPNLTLHNLHPKAWSVVLLYIIMLIGISRWRSRPTFDDKPSAPNFFE